MKYRVSGKSSKTFSSIHKSNHHLHQPYRRHYPLTAIPPSPLPASSCSPSPSSNIYSNRSLRVSIPSNRPMLSTTTSLWTRDFRIVLKMAERRSDWEQVCMPAKSYIKLIKERESLADPRKTHIIALKKCFADC